MKNKIIWKKKVKINDLISIIFKSLCKEVMAIFILKVIIRKFNNRGLKVKAMESLVK